MRTSYFCIAILLAIVTAAIFSINSLNAQQTLGGITGEVTDASGGVSVEAHERAIQRLVQAGAVPVTWMGVLSEWQRDWAREATVPAVAEIMFAHGGSTGTTIAWEAQLLATGGKKQ